MNDTDIALDLAAAKAAVANARAALSSAEEALRTIERQANPIVEVVPGVSFQEINCTGDDCDFTAYPNTGHCCDWWGCKEEATVAVAIGGQIWMSCEADKVNFGQ